MSKTLNQKLKNKELSSTDILFYSGIAFANSGLLRLAAEVERSKSTTQEIEREK